MKEELKKIIKEALKKLKTEGKLVFDMPEIDVDYPKGEAFGDYTTNVAMVLGKMLKINSLEIAEKIIKEIEKISAQGGPAFGWEVVKPGYINFYLAKAYLQNNVKEINNLGGKYGNLKNKEKVMVEYSQPNTHKEFHIGHLRNVTIGSALVNILRKSGREVVVANYIGDTGTHVAKCLWGLEKFHAKEKLEEIPNKVEFLGKVYSEAAQKIEDSDEYKEEFKKIQKKFEEGDKKLVALWKKTREWSLDGFNKIYEQLGVEFDVYFYESEEEIEGKKMLPELLKTKVIKESQGAIIADLSEYALGVLVLRRSDGAALYGLKDIPLAIKKFKKFKIDSSLYLVDVRQDLYFRQIFKTLELIGFKKKMVHIGYDFVNLKGGKGMSSRKGNIIPAETLMREVKERVMKKFPESPHPEEISLGAIKFFMLKYSAASKIEFDIEESAKLEGVTGPYVQYACARIQSILEKSKVHKVRKAKSDLSLLIHPKELDLIRELHKFPELIEEISRSYEVHKFPYYAIKLADKFHSFYNDCLVLDEKNPALSGARLNLVNAVRIVLAEVLRIIGVKAPDRM
jgi:arginyl-tRNA synthetase